MQNKHKFPVPKKKQTIQQTIEDCVHNLFPVDSHAASLLNQVDERDLRLTQMDEDYEVQISERKEIIHGLGKRKFDTPPCSTVQCSTLESARLACSIRFLIALKPRRSLHRALLGLWDALQVFRQGNDKVRSCSIWMEIRGLKQRLPNEC